MLSEFLAEGINWTCFIINERTKAYLLVTEYKDSDAHSVGIMLFICQSSCIPKNQRQLKLHYLPSLFFFWNIYLHTILGYPSQHLIFLSSSSSILLVQHSNQSLVINILENHINRFRAFVEGRAQHG